MFEKDCQASKDMTGSFCMSLDTFQLWVYVNNMYGFDTVVDQLLRSLTKILRLLWLSVVQSVLSN